MDRSREDKLARPDQGPRELIIHPTVARRIYFGAGLLSVIALVISVVEPRDWDVDATSLGLIGLIFAIPLIEQIRKLKFGSMELELDAVRRDVVKVAEWVGDLADDDAAADTVIEQTARAAIERTGTRTFTRIVWVDDRPDNNELEIAELKRRFEIVTATTTEAGIAEVGKSPENTAVITDAVRWEGDRRNVNAGRDLILQVKELFPRIPIYLYAGVETVDVHGPEFEKQGARLATATFPELARGIRTDARISFEAEVADVLQDVGTVEPQARGVDFIVSTGRERVAVEVKDYRRTPKTDAVEVVLARIRDLITSGDAERGIIVAPRNVFLKVQHDRARPDVALISIDRLREALGPRQGD